MSANTLVRTVIATAIASLFSSPAWAEPDEFELTGEVGLGALGLQSEPRRDVNRDLAKAFEYRDLQGGTLSLVNLHGRSRHYYIDLFAENLGRDDQFLNLRGGSYNNFKYQLFSDRLQHNFAFGARTPYSAPGAAEQTAILPNLNPASWNTYDMTYRRRNDGGAVEFNFGSPFYARVDANQVSFNGNKLQAYAQGTSPGNGFVDFAIPVDYTTKNLGFEFGYGSRKMQLSVNYQVSNFENQNPVLAWRNGFFNGTDRSPLAPDNDYTRWSANAVLKQLPVGSTLALRYTTSRAENDVNLLASMLSTPATPGGVGTTPASNPTQTVFRGEINYDTYSIALNSNPSKAIDTKLYLNHFKKENASTKIDWLALPTGFGCGDAPVVTGPPATSSCNGELFSYDKRNYGADVGVRLGGGNKLSFGYDTSQIERERKDSTETDEDRFSIDWKNQASDVVTARVKAQQMRRRSNFVGATLGTGPSDGLYLQRFVARYDVSNLDQSLFKAGLDVAPSEVVDLGLEVQFKQNDYKDTVLGRTKDDRQEVYLSIGIGRADAFRITAFWDQEVIKYDSTHRTINAGTCPIIAPATTPSACFDPFQPATAVAFNWRARNRDTTTSFGAGFDWPANERVVVKGSVVWSRSTGDVGVAAQTLASGAPAATLLPIVAYGNNEKFALTLKSDITLSRHWSLTAGASYEELKFNDVQFTNYTYVVPAVGSGTSTSYLSGWFANPDYAIGIVYLMAKYRF